MSGQEDLIGFIVGLPAGPAAEDFIALAGNELRPSYVAAGLPFPPAFDDAMAGLAARAGVVGGDSGAALAGKIVAYVKANPVPPEWSVQLGQLARAVAAGGGGDFKKNLERLGVAVSNSVVGQGPVPEGARKNSVFSRFQLHADLDKNKKS